MRTSTVILTFLLLGSSALAPRVTSQTTPATIEPACGMSAKVLTRTTVYFGLTKSSGGISEGQWKSFLRNEVTPQFPDGLTVWEADGQWRRPDGRIVRERSKVLLLVHEDTPGVRAILASIVSSYKQQFQQESVLWEAARVCAAF
jgi:hypothetical protein